MDLLMLDTAAALSLESLLEPFRRPTSGSDDDADAAAAVAIARQLLMRSRQLLTPQEQVQQAELDRMIAHLEDKATLVEMTDQAFRTHAPARVADQLTHILDLQGVPRFFSPLDRTLLRGFQSFGGYLPGVAVPLVKDKMRRETANVILPAETELLGEHLRQRHAEGVRMNVNFLGEAMLGRTGGPAAAEALPRCFAPTRGRVRVGKNLHDLLADLSDGSSAHGCRCWPTAWNCCTAPRCAHLHPARWHARPRKFVYLDMEEYRDLYLTARLLARGARRAGPEERPRGHRTAGLRPGFVRSA